MTALAPISLVGENLPGLIDRAATMLAGAKTAAEAVAGTGRRQRRVNGSAGR